MNCDTTRESKLKNLQKCRDDPPERVIVTLIKSQLRWCPLWDETIIILE